MPETTGQFLATLKESLADGGFVKLSLGHYTGGEKDLKKINIRKILIKRAEKLSFTYHYQTRDIVKNYDIPGALEKIGAMLNSEFHTATLQTTGFDLKFENGTLKKLPPSVTETPSLDHDRSKKRHVATAGKNYLHALGITDDKGNVLKTAQDKYRQIDKYVEILGGLIKDMPPDKVKKITDMGAGKGYLTFALYDYLSNTLNLRPEITGVETRADLVALCNDIASDSGFNSLRFIEGTIDNYDSAGTNILIALHACDTATDDALYKGVTAGAELIVVAPCCHKQIRREMEKNRSDEFTTFTRHGIFMERLAEMATDGLRAMILEHCGYNVKVFEFISDTHTAKNLMIVALKDGRQRHPDILETIRKTKEKFGISRHYLEQSLNLDLQSDGY